MISPVASGWKFRGARVFVASTRGEGRRFGTPVFAARRKDEEEKDLEEKKRRGLVVEDTRGDGSPISMEYTAGGGLTLDGADYYWFFTKLMIGTVILFIPFAMLYKPRTYLHGNVDEDTEEVGLSGHRKVSQ